MSRLFFPHKHPPLPHYKPLEEIPVECYYTLEHFLSTPHTHFVQTIPRTLHRLNLISTQGTPHKTPNHIFPLLSVYTFQTNIISNKPGDLLDN